MSRIILLLHNRENSRQLNDLLAERYEIVPTQDLDEPFDLAVVDGPSFQRLQPDLARCKQSEEPLFLPLLLLAPSQDKQALTQRLWQHVDDVIAPPIEKIELLARLEMLLRTRQLSLNLEVHSRELQKRYEELDGLRLELEEKNGALEILHEEKNQLLGMAAHDLRTPLGIVAAYSQFLEQEAGETLSTEQHDFLAKIRSSSAFMHNLVDDLLDMTHFAAGKMELRLNSVDLVALVENNTALNRPLAAQKQIELTCRHTADIPPCRADGTKLEQVLNNLVGNALKFSDPDSAIEVAVERSEGQIVLSVRDEGPGIPLEEQAIVFEPFQQTSVKSPSGEKSSGLGLAIVRRIAEAHGGNAWVESTVGQGATFGISLPVAAPNQPQEIPDLPVLSGEVFDKEAALQRFGDENALRYNINAFVTEYPSLLDLARRAITRSESRAFLRAVSKLSWHLGTLSAPSALDAALALESAGRTGPLCDILPDLEQLEREIQRLQEILI